MCDVIGNSRHQATNHHHNVSHVAPVDHFAANKFSKQQYLRPERSLQFLIKSLAIVTIRSSY